MPPNDVNGGLLRLDLRRRLHQAVEHDRHLLVELLLREGVPLGAALVGEVDLDRPALAGLELRLGRAHRALAGEGGLARGSSARRCWPPGLSGRTTHASRLSSGAVVVRELGEGGDGGVVARRDGGLRRRPRRAEAGSWWWSRRPRSSWSWSTPPSPGRPPTAPGVTTGRKRSSAVLPDQCDGLVAVLHAGEVDDDVAPLPGDLGLEGAEGVDPVADDVDGDVERVGPVLPDRRQHDRGAALQVEAEHRLVVARERREERADHDDQRHDQEDDVPAHGSVVARAVVGGVRRRVVRRCVRPELRDLGDRVAGDRDARRPGRSRARCGRRRSRRIVPKIPPMVTTSSPTASVSSSARWAVARRRCGRTISRKNAGAMTTK